MVKMSIITTAMQVNDLTINNIHSKCGNIWIMNDNFIQMVHECCDSQFDLDRMEPVYNVKKELLENISLFIEDNSLFSFSKLIDVHFSGLC